MRWRYPLITIFLLGCSHQPPAKEAAVDPIQTIEYQKLIENNSGHTNQYTGFYQTFQTDMTILTNEVRTAGLHQRSYFLQWDKKQYQDEHEKMAQENSAYAKFFFRFYCPDHEYDDLHKPKTIWRVYLDFSGQRFEGKIKKVTDRYAELATLYPYMDHFSTPYEVTFNVPMTTIEASASKVTLTSSLGSAEFSFPVKK